jgi:hypothetical protein
MLQAAMRYASIAISAIVVLSFAMFATDQTKSSSAKEVATVSNETSTTVAQQPQQQPQPQQAQQTPAPATPKPHGEPRKSIDDLDRQILKPFDGAVRNTDNAWAKKGVPSLLALVVFGFLLNLLAGYLPKPKPSS